MTRTRMAVIGCGHLGTIHARLLASRDDVDLVAVVDPVPEGRNRVAESHGCQPLADPRELAGRVDAAVVAAPTGLHAEVSLPLLEAGIDLLVEKPLAVSVEDARAITVAARRLGRIVSVGHVERFNLAWRSAAARAGEVSYLEARRLTPFTFRSLDVGVVHDLMIHDIDLVLSLAPGRLDQIEARGLLATGGHEDAVRARLTFASGLVADLVASRISPRAERTVSMWAVGGMVAVDLTAKSVEVIAPAEPVRSGTFVAAAASPAERATLKDRFFADILPLETITVPDANAIAAEHDDLLRAIRGGGEPLVPASAGAAAVEVAARVLEVLRASRFGGGRLSAGAQTATIPLFSHRKTG
ncbi:MAG: Gfo/Idh/MocA family oxidoreductase [Pirellulales bacterium]